MMRRWSVDKTGIQPACISVMEGFIPQVLGENHVSVGARQPEASL
jgi:hypothetical protein